MSITQIIDNFYETIRPFKRGPPEMQPGQFAWVPSFFVETVPFVMNVERASSTTHTEVAFSIGQMTTEHFKRRTSLPVKAFHLAENEELVALRTKKRPCVLIAKNISVETNGDIKDAMKGKKHILHDAALFLPLFGVDSVTHAGGFPQALVDRIQVLMYEQFFYFTKGTAPGCTSAFALDQSIGRLDRMFVAALHHPAVSPCDVRLTNDAWNLLLCSTARYLNIPLDKDQAENFQTILNLIQEALPVSSGK